MALRGVCMVVLTHRSPVVHPEIRDRVPVPTIVSSDNPAHRYHEGVDLYVEHPFFDRKEDIIGYHVAAAVNHTFRTFDWCSVVLLVEEDARLSRDFASVLAGALPWMINGSYGCFTSMNWAWHDAPHKWRPDRLRVVTSTFPEIVWATTHRLWHETLLPLWGRPSFPPQRSVDRWVSDPVSWRRYPAVRQLHPGGPPQPRVSGPGGDPHPARLLEGGDPRHKGLGSAPEDRGLQRDGRRDAARGPAVHREEVAVPETQRYPGDVPRPPAVVHHQADAPSRAPAATCWGHARGGEELSMGALSNNRGRLQHRVQTDGMLSGGDLQLHAATPRVPERGLSGLRHRERSGHAGHHHGRDLLGGNAPRF